MKVKMIEKRSPSIMKLITFWTVFVPIWILVLPIVTLVITIPGILLDTLVELKRAVVFWYSLFGKTYREVTRIPQPRRSIKKVSK